MVLDNVTEFAFVRDEKRATFIKTRFYQKRDCIKMRKDAEPFHANKGCKFATVVFIPVSPF